jgi:hypothetical protein
MSEDRVAKLAARPAFTLVKYWSSYWSSWDGRLVLCRVASLLRYVTQRFSER